MARLNRQLVLRAAAALVALTAVLGFASVGQAANDNGKQPCFFLRAWDGQWKVTPDARTMYVRENGVIWRWDLRQPIPLLKSTWAVLNTSGTNDAVCRPEDLHLIVSDRLGGKQIAIVNSITPLSAEEASAL